MTRALALVALVALVGCGGKPVGKSSAGQGGGRAAGSAPVPARGVPAEVVMLGVSDMSAAWIEQLVTGMGGTEAEAKALSGDLMTYLRKTTGLELGELRGMTFFALEGDAGGAFIFGPVGGEWKGPPADGELAMARLGDALVVGTPAAVDAARAVVDGKAPGLAKDHPLVALMASEAAGAGSAVAVDLTRLPLPPGPASVLAGYGARLGVASIGPAGLRVAVRGDGEKLASLVRLVEQQLAVIERGLAAGKERALAEASTDTGPDGEAMGLILQAHSVGVMKRKLMPKLDGDTLRLEVGLGGADPLVLVAGVGVASAIAIPAFMKYMRKSKTVEASMGVKRMYDGVRAHVLETGKLPASAPMTPAVGSCCTGPDGKCAPDAAQWKGPWSVLGFSIDDPHYYSFEYVSDGSMFTARAMGDLDCDGDYSTFEMAGEIAPDGSLRGGNGIYKNKELE